jgi:CRISPR-associated protein Cmr3
VSLIGPFAVHRPRIGAGTWSPVFSAPSDAVRVSEDGRPTVRWLKPGPPDNARRVRGCWTADDEATAIEALWRGRSDDVAKPLPMPRWWSSAQFASWLVDPEHDPGPAFPSQPVTRSTTQLSIEPGSQAAREGALFSVDTVELRMKDGEFGVLGRSNVDVPTDRFWSLGGEARLAAAALLDDDPLEVPEAILRAWSSPSRFVRLLLVTPGSFSRGWRPGWLAPSEETLAGEWLGLHWTLRAAFVARAEACSGWDFVARGPKPSRRLVPAGSVFYLECERDLTESDATRLWLASLQDRGQETPAQDERDGLNGQRRP